MTTRTVLVVCLLAAGCGGGKKGGDTTPAGGGGGGAEVTEHVASDSGGMMIPPEKMDEVERMFVRKNQMISRCLAAAVDNKEVPRNTKGAIGLEVVVGTHGKADSVKVIRSDIPAQSVQDCVVGHVKNISFPELPKPYETSHTYVMETM